jgi:glycosyltransferase involved in cell wall biosynthesis
MQILQIVPSVSLVYGGPSQMVLGFSAALARQGADVTLLTTDANGDAGQPPLDVPLDRPVIQDGYQVRYFRCSPFRRYKFSINLLSWLWQHASEYDIAHIHALFSPVSSMAATVARSRQLPYLLRPLGTLDPADLQKKRQLKQLYAAVLERPNLAGAAAIHFTSEQEAKVSERFGVTTHDVVLPLGVALPDIPDQAESYLQPLGIPTDGTPLVLFMSRIDPKKGMDLLIPALEQLQQSGINFHFILAGGNPQDPAYEQQVGDRLRASALAERTTITGFVTGATKAALLARSDLFVLPSYYENFGIAVAEAMGAGLPVVISDQVHIWQDIQGSQSGWVIPCQVAPLVDALRQALTDADARRTRGGNAQQFAQEHYSWDAIARQALKIYEDLTG